MHAIAPEPVALIEQRWRLGDLGISTPRIAAPQADVVCSGDF